MILQHFFIRDDWEQVYTLLFALEASVQGLDVNHPDSFKNRDIFKQTKDHTAFLHNLCTQQAIRLKDFLPRLRNIEATCQSVLTLFEDDRLDGFTSERCQTLKEALLENLTEAMTHANTQKHLMRVDAPQTEASKILEDVVPDPVLTLQDSFDNFSDAAKAMLRRMKDDEPENLEKLLSPQERLFHDIRLELHKSVSNISSAAIKTSATLKTDDGTIQFARATVAVQGRIDRRGLKNVPRHHIVQIAGTSMAPGFSPRDADTMPPTYFFHDQTLAVFNPDVLPSHWFHITENRRDKIQRVRERYLCYRDYRDVLEKPLYHKSFPGSVLVWLVPPETADKLALSATLKAYLVAY